MANERIEISNSGINNALTELRSVKDRIESCNKSTTEELGSINEAWKGADATLYVYRMKEDFTILLDRYVESLDSYINFLEQVFPQYQNFDESRGDVL